MWDGGGRAITGLEAGLVVALFALSGASCAGKTTTGASSGGSNGADADVSRSQGGHATASGGAPANGGTGGRPAASGGAGGSASGGSASGGGASEGGGSTAFGGSGGTTGRGGSEGSGGRRLSEPVAYLAPHCTSATTCPVMPSFFTPSSVCCNSNGQCGFDVSATPSVPSECQALGQPGVASAACSGGQTGSCCRFDGTCGLDLSHRGLGCVALPASGAPTECDVGGACNFAFAVTTNSTNGRYAPHNVGAVWVEDAEGRFVKTLATWGRARLIGALAWMASSMGNQVDALSAATRRAHGPVIASWNCTDVAHVPVAQGRYRVCVTFTEQNSLYLPDGGTDDPKYCQGFDIDGTPVHVSSSGEEPFTSAGLTLSY